MELHRRLGFSSMAARTTKKYVVECEADHRESPLTLNLNFVYPKLYHAQLINAIENTYRSPQNPAQQDYFTPSSRRSLRAFVWVAGKISN